ncbi:hypothetical protein J4426_01855 [Candidatus Woesearchaeota archaeon]|nr:hypothetical protein [Candidatus Woesearchaeota archaeon]
MIIEYIIVALLIIIAIFAVLRNLIHWAVIALVILVIYLILKYWTGII